ncbi:MAG: hypothetical protein NVS3B25_17950 [Hymenobacter sp.]
MCPLRMVAGSNTPVMVSKISLVYLAKLLLVISQSDLPQYLSCSVEAATRDARDCNPTLTVLTLSSYKGDGLDAWCDWLLERVAEKRARAAGPQRA